MIRLLSDMLFKQISFYNRETKALMISMIIEKMIYYIFRYTQNYSHLRTEVVFENNAISSGAINKQHSTFN